MIVVLGIFALVATAKSARIVPSVSDEYYWKEYGGVIPPDALPGGRDLDGMITFIGQAYIHKLGIFVAQIYPGKKEVEVAAYGVKKTSMNIKILCVSNKDNFEWVPTNHTHFHVDMTDKIPVIGGFDFNGNKGMVHIGKVHFQGFLKVGEITSYLLENAQLHIPHNSAELSAKFYHVLVLRQLPVYGVRAPVAEILSKSGNKTLL